MMRKISLLVMFALFVGCAGAPVVHVPRPDIPDVNCNAYLDTLTAGKPGPSIIRQTIPNPCDAHTILASLAAVGVVWDTYKAAQVVQWADQVAYIVRSGVSYADLNTIVAAQIAAFNKKIGGTYMIASTLLVQFSQQSMITEQDRVILIESLERIKASAKLLAAIE